MKKGRVSYPSFFMNYYNYIRMPQGSTKHKLAFKGATIMTNIARYTAADLPALMEKITRNSINRLNGHLHEHGRSLTTRKFDQLILRMGF